MTYSFPTADWLMRIEEVGFLGFDLFGPAQPLDFTRPFLPEALARTAALAFLSEDERRRLNQIRGHAHLMIVALIDGLTHSPCREPSAHRDLLRRLRRAFAAGFGSVCELAGPLAELISRHRARTGLSRALLGEHAMWMARRHVQAAALSARTLEPGFTRLLLQGWVERAPSDLNRPDALTRHAAGATPADLDAAVADYRDLCAGLTQTLQAQAVLDVSALERAVGRELSLQHREQTLMVQQHAYWWTYIGTGLTHPRFAAAVRRLVPGALSELEPLMAFA